jgi:hypothetical protein
MTKLVWDQTGSRKYETGCDHGVLFPADTSKNANKIYGTGVAWNGLTSVTESPDGAEANDIYADNIKYGSIRSAETFGGTIEAYTYPDEFAACDGSAEPVKGVRIGQQSRKPFGLVYRTLIGNDTPTEEDDGYIIHIVYNATASPSEKQYETVNDSPEAITFSWEFETTPTNVAGFKPTSLITVDSTKIETATLTKLESKLFGSDDSEPELPTPDEVLTLLGYAAG